MVEMTGHGGRCCGRRHLYSFYGPGDQFEARHAAIQATHRDRTNLMTEVVLTGSQLRHSRERIEAAGYRKVASWRNSNSGNVCHMFMHARDAKWGDDAIYIGNRVRVVRSGREGVVLGSSPNGVQIRYENGQTRTVKRSSIINISEKI